MIVYDVNGLRAEIIRPQTNLTTYALQKKPFALCNASLYNMTTRVPIGTLVENGQYTHNQGNGYGFGIADGKFVFGRPWDRAWQEYLTGYTACVLDGKYVPPSFADSYVFPCKLNRIAIGQTKDGKTVIVTDNNVTLQEFANHAIANGIGVLVNLDGGGSRYLYYNGTVVFASYRIPYNAVAFYKDVAKPSESQYPVPTRLLTLWCRGEDVKWLQDNLNRLGYRSGIVDGIFGWNTWFALYAYQRTWSKFPDGICGANTRGHLLGTL